MVLRIRGLALGYGVHDPAVYPASKFCCAGAYNTPDLCKKGPDVTMSYSRVVHEYCNVASWPFDDDSLGVKKCKSGTTRFLVQFFDP